MTQSRLIEPLSKRALPQLVAACTFRGTFSSIRRCRRWRGAGLARDEQGSAGG